MKILKTVSGRTKQIPDFPQKQGYPGQVTESCVAGLDPDGRIVIDPWGERNKSYDPEDRARYLFGLTLCCNASDKGTEHGVVCRGCYSSHDTGSYLYQAQDGSFPELDPVESIA